MDVVTHGLASFALTRAAFPRAARTTMIGALIAGTVADLDVISARFGPSAFLDWHRTYTHSFLAAALIALLVSSAAFLTSRARQNKDAPIVILLAAFGASLFHLILDSCQNDQVAALWPFRSRR